MPAQSNPPRRTTPATKTAPPPLVTEVSRLASALENASDPTRAQRELGDRVAVLAGQLQKVRAAGLRTRREAITAAADTARETRRAALRARRVELLARPLPPPPKASAGGKAKSTTAVRASAVPRVPARKALPRRTNR